MHNIEFENLFSFLIVSLFLSFRICYYFIWNIFSGLDGMLILAMILSLRYLFDMAHFLWKFICQKEEKKHT